MNLKIISYRLKIRSVLQKAPIEELNITKEELQREYERRRSKKK